MLTSVKLSLIQLLIMIRTENSEISLKFPQKLENSLKNLKITSPHPAKRADWGGS